MSETNFKKLSRDMSGRHGFGGSIILVSVFVLVVLFFVWAGWAELDNVTRGDGRVVSSYQNQVIQSAEAGVITERYVSENSVVAEGDILFEIDAVDLSSEYARLKQRLRVLELKEQRLNAEITGQDFVVSDEMADSRSTLVATEVSLFTARRSELSGQLAVLGQRLFQREQSISSAENAIATAEKTAELLEQEVALVEPLVRDNIAPATRLLELQRQLEQVRGEIISQAGTVAQAKSGMAEIEAEIENTKANFILRSMDELNSVVAEQSELRESMPRLEERLSRTQIRAPMAGIVSTLNYRTTGGFVKPGDVMAELVPTGVDLMVVARIMPKDISQIRLDDVVKIRLSAYDSARYGAVPGRVTRISADAVVDQANRGASYYEVDVAVEGQLVLETGEVVTLIPGMTASVDVLSGKRSVLEYLWQPIARVQELALRD